MLTPISANLVVAALALSFIAMHVFLSIISFDAFKPNASWTHFISESAVILFGHLAVSLLVSYTP